MKQELVGRLSGETAPPKKTVASASKAVASRDLAVSSLPVRGPVCIDLQWSFKGCINKVSGSFRVDIRQV